MHRPLLHQKRKDKKCPSNKCWQLRPSRNSHQEIHKVPSFKTPISQETELKRINTIVTGARAINTAAEAIENIFKSILNEHESITREKELQSLCI